MACPQVALRIRPLNSAEQEEGATVIAHKVGDQVRLGSTEMASPHCVHFTINKHSDQTLLQGAEQGLMVPTLPLIDSECAVWIAQEPQSCPGQRDL
jgi:hypothetical protein